MKLTDLPPNLQRICTLWFRIQDSHRTLEKLTPEVVKHMYTDIMPVYTKKSGFILVREEYKLQACVTVNDEFQTNYEEQPECIKNYCNELVMLTNAQEEFRNCENSTEILKELHSLVDSTLKVKRKDRTLILTHHAGKLEFKAGELW